jgi:hypothetical protein
VLLQHGVELLLVDLVGHLDDSLDCVILRGKTLEWDVGDDEGANAEVLVGVKLKSYSVNVAKVGHELFTGLHLQAKELHCKGK